jgi:NAD(P)-dependent dehydrogenase (short-subunit alcohol dehydrogenase family)
VPADRPVPGLTAGPPTGAQAERVTEPPGPGGGAPRVALVAGAARGIGAATVAALAAAGWRVMAVDRCADDPDLPTSFDACFAPDEAKKRWKAKVDDFAARNAPVAG